MTKDGRSKGSLNKGRVLDLNGVKIRSLESAIFKIGSLARTKENTVRQRKVWLSLVLHKSYVDTWITSLEHPGSLSTLLAE